MVTLGAIRLTPIALLLWDKAKLLCWITVLLLGFVAGCATVRISSGADVKVSQGLGVLSVHVHPKNTEPLVVATEGLGIVAASQSTTIGAVREFVTSFPELARCHAVVVVQSNVEFDALRQILITDPDRLNNICLTTKEGKTWSH